ncbi:hypothetical protein ckrop_1861 [Corynebacterium kroppenstedtii DSM 44385]|uniref:Uncharacterized protein n=1 Tax=Corynebacterium kroppenstedtii (strain DSM 44385 / JCM 11950 / CIP 105744 / CCUG 35717) TaxID=645127 RepID=C4LL74_CORK4|nr:hypothetical protein ckrop_1861 [Corynebacterium kroppenstedtii DSM 44385]
MQTEALRVDGKPTAGLIADDEAATFERRPKCRNCVAPKRRRF